MIPIYIPYLNKKAKKYVLKCIDTNWISSQGSYIRKFEKTLAIYNKVKLIKKKPLCYNIKCRIIYFITIQLV